MRMKRFLKKYVESLVRRNCWECINNQMRKGLTAEVQNERKDCRKIRTWACHFYNKLCGDFESEVNSYFVAASSRSISI